MSWQKDHDPGRGAGWSDSGPAILQGSWWGSCEGQRGWWQSYSLWLTGYYFHRWEDVPKARDCRVGSLCPVSGGQIPCGTDTH